MNTRGANEAIHAIQAFLILKVPMAQLIMGVAALVRASTEDSIHDMPNNWRIDDTKLIYLTITRLDSS